MFFSMSTSSPKFICIILHKFMINLWFGKFLKIPQFIVVWGGIADELGGTVCLLLQGGPPVLPAINGAMTPIKRPFK